MSHKGTDQHYIECATCINYSKFYCNTCHQRICEECRDVHLRETESRKHEVVHYQNRLKELPTEICPVHATRVLELFCVYCSAPICSKCFATDHNGHHVVDLEVIYNESLQLYQKELIKIRDTILPRWVDIVEYQREEIENAKKEFAKLRLSMKKSADEIKAAVDTILADKNAKLDKMESSVLNEMAKQEKKSEDYISYLNKKADDYTSEMFSCKPTELIALNKEKTRFTLKFPEIIEPGIPSFTKGIIIKKEVEKFFGSIKPSANGKILKEKVKKIQESSKSFVTTQPTKQSKVAIIMYSSHKEVLEVKSPHVGAIIHLSPVPSGTFWASGDNENLLQLDTKGNILQKIYTGKQVEGFHTVTKEGDLFYTDYAKKAIYKVNSDMTITAFLNTGEWRPRSIFSSHINGDILVGMKKDTAWKITRYSRGGIKLQNIQKNDLFDSVRYITENINGDICITSDREVVVLTSSGEHRFSYHGSSGHRFQPYGICTDALGNVMVCNGREVDQHERMYPFFSFLKGSGIGVHMLNQHGEFFGIVNEYQITAKCSPRALCVYDQQNLIIGDAFRPLITVFNYLQRYVES